MKSIPSAGLADASARQNCLLLDVRTPGEFAEAHIEGSWNLPLPDLARFRSEVEARGKGKNLVLVCRSGGRAARGCETLAGFGLDQAAVLEGGIEAWMASGQEVIRGEKGMSIERQVRVAAGSLVVLGCVLTWFVHPGFIAIPAFVGCGLVVAGLTDTCGMAMILARLPMNRRR